MEARELDVVTRLHAAALPHGFFARLGRRFLSAYLDTYRGAPHAVAFVAIQGDEPRGYLVGVVAPELHARWVVRRHGLRLTFLGVVGLLARPGLLAYFVRTRAGRYVRALVRRLRRSPATAAATSRKHQAAVLSHVAVSPAAQGRGVGQALVLAFAAHVAAEGRNGVELVTRTGGGAENFYLRLGFHPTTKRVDAEGVGWSGYRLAVG